MILLAISTALEVSYLPKDRLSMSANHLHPRLEIQTLATFMTIKYVIGLYDHEHHVDGTSSLSISILLAQK
jgi:hypothetical protein